jgi:hypothetical protein
MPPAIDTVEGSKGEIEGGKKEQQGLSPHQAAIAPRAGKSGSAGGSDLFQHGYTCSIILDKHPHVKRNQGIFGNYSSLDQANIPIQNHR